MIHRLLNSLILLPDRYCYQRPVDVGLVAEDVAFPNAQGVALRGVFCRRQAAPGDAGETPGSTPPVVLFCPGTSGNLSAHLHYVELLCRAGFAVLGFDYTGFGRSAGEASLRTLVSDVLCAGEFLQRHRRVERFGVFGLSIGASLALLATAVRPEPVAGVAVEGLALQKEVVRGILAYGAMGPRYIEAITCNGGAPIPRRVHRLNTVCVGTWLANVLANLGLIGLPFQLREPRHSVAGLADVPVFFIHGLADPLLPFETTLEVYHAKPGAKRLWLIPEVGHAQEPVLAQDGEYARQLGDFFHGVLPGAAPGSLLPPVCDIEPRGVDAAVLRLHNPGPPGLILTTVVSARAVDVRTLWVQKCAEIPTMLRSPQAWASCLRLFEVTGQGEAARPHLTPRGERYRAAFQELIRQLSQTLHESRLADLEPLLAKLPPYKPEAPFDFFLGIYCIQMMRRARRKFPHIARAAAAAFERYWPYATSETPGDALSPWHLVAQVRGHTVRSSSTRLERSR